MMNECTDAVSRDAVLEAVSEGCQELRGVYGRCEELINDLPSVTPTRQTMSVIEDIRAEIEELDRYYDNDYFSTNNCPMYKCSDVLQIIDKHTNET